ncbi:MAG: hypothetical protein U0M02_02255 [Acutalibacteraceae bacterium]|nr:hypothetical protein [Acutalibacteraceae bacterium]
MTRDSNTILNDIKHCIRTNTPVDFLGCGGYKPKRIVLRFKYDWVYDIHLEDPKRSDVTIVCSTSDISCPYYDFPEETLQIPKLAAFALKRKIPVDCGEDGIRTCAGIHLVFENSEWCLLAELHDVGKIKPVIYNPVNSVNWPNSGGGYICAS